MTEARDPGIPGVTDAVEIGRGGFAVVYRATQPEFRRTVAAKVLTVELDERARMRFERECHALGSLSDHPGIVTVYSAGYTADGRPFLLMPFHAGGSYQEGLDVSGAMPWQDVVRVGITLAEALGAAHGEGVLHRDIKPANVLRSRHGHPILADFGIARVAGSQNSTDSASITGSAHYMAPEVIDGQEPSVASDIYALGATLYTLLAGRPAFAADTDHGIVPVLHRIITHIPPPVEHAPEGLSAALLRCMAKDPAHRFPDAASLAAALAQVRPDGVSSTSSGPTGEGSGWAPGSGSAPVSGEGQASGAAEGRHRRVLIPVLALLGLAVVGGVLLAVLRPSGATYDPALVRPVLPDDITVEGEAAPAIASGTTTVTGTLPAGVARVLPLPVEVGQFVRIHVASPGEGGFDPFLVLLDRDGTLLTEVDDSGGPEGKDPILDWTFDEAGTYAVVLRAFDGFGSGEYELTTRVLDLEPLAGRITGRLSAPYDVGVYRWAGTGGGVTTFEARTPDLDIALAVEDPVGEYVEDDDGAGGTDARIVVHDTRAGDHFVMVTAHDGTSTGEYTVEVTTGG